MQLKYRGIGYNYSPVQLNVIETGETVQFLGQTHRIKRSLNLKMVNTNIFAKFRGIPYQLVSTAPENPMALKELLLGDMNQQVQHSSMPTQTLEKKQLTAV